MGKSGGEDEKTALERHLFISPGYRGNLADKVDDLHLQWNEVLWIPSYPLLSEVIKKAIRFTI